MLHLLLDVKFPVPFRASLLNLGGGKSVSLRLRVELVFDSVGLAFLYGWYYRAVDAW